VTGGRTAALIANRATVGAAASAVGRRGGVCDIAVLSNWIISNLLRAIRALAARSAWSQR
jgi:hypothetical protein